MAFRCTRNLQHVSKCKWAVGRSEPRRLQAVAFGWRAWRKESRSRLYDVEVTLEEVLAVSKDFPFITLRYTPIAFLVLCLAINSSA